VRLLPAFTGDDYFLSKLWRGSAGEPEAWGATEAEWWDAHVFSGTSLTDPFEKRDNGGGSEHNTHVRVGGVRLWGGKLDWLLHDTRTLHCAGKFVSRAEASDHPYLRLDLDLRPGDGDPKG